MEQSSQKSKPPVPLPRDLIVLACIWIAGSWVMSIGLHSPTHPVASSYTDAVLMMCILTMSGITIGWPLLRMSCSYFPRPYIQTGLDMLVLVCAVQVTIWPLRLLSSWSISQTVVISAVLAAWILVSGAFVLLAMGSPRASVRTLVMLLVMLTVSVGAILPLGSGFPWWSPIDGASAAVHLNDYAIAGAPLWTGANAVAPTLVAGAGLWIIASGARIAGFPSSGRETERVDSR